MSVELRWYVPVGGSYVKKLQWRESDEHFLWSLWQEVPTEYYVKDTTESVSTLPLAKE